MRINATSLGMASSACWLLAGTLPDSPRLAVVGSRAAHREPLSCVPAIVASAARRGHSLVSGGARGVDAAVHRAGLAAGVPQLAVLPCGPDDLYPPEHASLFQEIAEAPGCGVLFAQSAGGVRSRGMFASRNTIVVSAAAAVLVVEARMRSGSWGTGRQALRRGLPLAALANSSGCADLIAAGARGLSIASVKADVDAWLDDLAGGPPTAPPVWPVELQWLRDALVAAGNRGLGIDDLDDRAGSHAALLLAEMHDLVVESPPGRYHARK
mgnify:CR=1 FL=1